MTKDELLAAAKALPPDERADLATQLLATLEPDDAPPTDVMRLTLDRPIAAATSDPPSDVGWDDLKSQILGGGF